MRRKELLCYRSGEPTCIEVKGINAPETEACPDLWAFRKGKAVF